MKMNIIAVDDEKFPLLDLETAVKKALPDAAVASFRKPHDALEYAKNNRLDFAFLDIEMLGMNGIELAGFLKEIHEKINIIFVTGYPEYALASYKVKASDFIVKPVSAEAVLNAMAELRHPIGDKVMPETITKR